MVNLVFVHIVCGGVENVTKKVGGRIVMRIYYTFKQRT